MDSQDNIIELKKRGARESKSALDRIVQEGAQRMLQAAIEAEVAAYIGAHKELRDKKGIKSRFMCRRATAWSCEMDISRGARCRPVPGSST
jgi:hypothetical protein